MVHLDRFFCNKGWDNFFSSLCLQALASSMSDHCPLLLCNQERPPRKAKFKFEQFWTRVPYFMETVQRAWEQPVLGNSALMIFHNKLLNTAKALTKWSKSLFGNARMQLHIVQEVTLRLDIAQEQRALTPAEILSRKDLKVRVLGLAAVEKARRRQCSRITWIKEGDADGG